MIFRHFERSEKSANRVTDFSPAVSGIEMTGLNYNVFNFPISPFQNFPISSVRFLRRFHRRFYFYC